MNHLISESIARSEWPISFKQPIFCHSAPTKQFDGRSNRLVSYLHFLIFRSRVDTREMISILCAVLGVTATAFDNGGIRATRSVKIRLLLAKIVRQSGRLRNPPPGHKNKPIPIQNRLNIYEQRFYRFQVIQCIISTLSCCFGFRVCLSIDNNLVFWWCFSFLIALRNAESAIMFRSARRRNELTAAISQVGGKLFYCFIRSFVCPEKKRGIQSPRNRRNAKCFISAKRYIFIISLLRRTPLAVEIFTRTSLSGRDVTRWNFHLM